MNLYLAYQVSQTNIPLPDVTLILGDYRWKVHSQLLIPESDFFKKALQGKFQEAISKEIVLHDDNPWIITLLVQYLYMNYFDDQSNGSLERIMIGNASVKAYRQDKTEYENMPVQDRLVMLINTADKYMMCGLINAMPRLTPWHDCRQVLSLPELFTELVTNVTCDRLVKYNGLKRAVAGYLSETPELIRDAMVQEWLSKDAGFGNYVANACVVRFEGMKGVISDLKTRTQIAEDSAKNPTGRKRKSTGA